MLLDILAPIEVTNSEILNNDWIRYDIQNSIELFFHLKNNKLFRITTLDNYKGKLFGKIGVGTTEKELLEAESSFVYDEFEEVCESPKGVFVEMDAETIMKKTIFEEMGGTYIRHYRRMGIKT